MKIVQRLPVRIELTNYDPDKEPLFVGLSVVPYVSYKEPAAEPMQGTLLSWMALTIRSRLPRRPSTSREIPGIRSTP